MDGVVLDGQTVRECRNVTIRPREAVIKRSSLLVGFAHLWGCWRRKVRNKTRSRLRSRLREPSRGPVGIRIPLIWNSDRCIDGNLPRLSKGASKRAPLINTSHAMRVPVVEPAESIAVYALGAAIARRPTHAGIRRAAAPSATRVDRRPKFRVLCRRRVWRRQRDRRLQARSSARRGGHAVSGGRRNK